MSTFKLDYTTEPFEEHLSSLELNVAAQLYAQPWRQYHNLGHAVAVANAAKTHPMFPDSKDIQVAILRAALWHDTVYEPGNTRNEPMSANMAAAWARNRGMRSIVFAAIMATTHQTTPSRLRECPEDAVLTDADLAGLAAPWNEYAYNTRRIRLEYLHHSVSEDDFNKGRVKWIKNMLERDSGTIYACEAWDDAYGNQARENLETELAMLEKWDEVTQ